jgi:hypothetical protein
VSYHACSFGRITIRTPSGNTAIMQARHNRAMITWKPPAPGLARSQLAASAFAFPKERKEPLTDAAHVRSAIARFNQVDGVSERERHQALDNIRAAAKYYGVNF